jgi:hypothetical protein
MDRIESNRLNQTPGNQVRGYQPAASATRDRPRPVLWTGSSLDRECSDLVPVLWDGTCLA